MNLSAGELRRGATEIREALDIYRRLLTEDHSHTAISYNNLAKNLDAQGKHAEAQPMYEKAVKIYHRLFIEDHPYAAFSYNNLATNLNAQGKYGEAQPLFEKVPEIYRRLLTDDHPHTAAAYSNVARNLNARGKYAEARDLWICAARSFESARLSVAFTGLELRDRHDQSRSDAASRLCAARLGEPIEAWQRLEEHLGRGLLDELAARKDHRLDPVALGRLRELTAELERLDKLVETTPGNLDQAGRAKRFAELRAAS